MPEAHNHRLGLLTESRAMADSMLVIEKLLIDSC